MASLISCVSNGNIVDPEVEEDERRAVECAGGEESMVVLRNDGLGLQVRRMPPDCNRLQSIALDCNRLRLIVLDCARPAGAPNAT